MNTRLKIILFLFLAAFAATIGRLFFLQVIEAPRYSEAAEKQQVFNTQVDSKRGSIFLGSLAGGEKKYIPVAITRRTWQVWVSPKDVLPEDREGLAKSVAGILSLDESLAAERIAKENDPYEPLKDGVEDEDLEKIKALASDALHWQEIDDRYYPAGELAAHVIGFVGRRGDEKLGQYGLEEFYNKTLAGKGGFLSGFRSSFGFLIRPFTFIAAPADGADIYLTIDYNIQLVLEKELSRARKQFLADGASGIVVEPKTGRVLAMASVPTFDPNTYEKVDSVSRFLNPNTQALFEPGSVFKPITMAAALDINVISPDLTYIDRGFVKIGGTTIKNATDEINGTQTMIQVLEKSLNTGVVFVVNRIPPGVWREYLENFGFAGRTGLDIVGELKGNIKNIRSSRKVEIATSAFGQGISTTPIGLTMAIAAIANKGEMVKPYLVEKISYPDKPDDEKPNSKESTRVIKEETADAVVKMMVSVVENGFGKNASISGYSVAGKTGTAQVADPRGGYSDKTIHSFIGFAPAFNPAFILLVKIDNPQVDYFSDRTAAPVFKEVGEFILHYYGIEPDRPIID